MAPRKPKVDPDSLFNEMLTSFLSKRVVDPNQKYQDFRQVFFGSEAGQRVFNEILSWGHFFENKVFTDKNGTVDSYREGFSKGERNICIKLISATHFEPKSQPQKTNKKGDL